MSEVPPPAVAAGDLLEAKTTTTTTLATGVLGRLLKHTRRVFKHTDAEELDANGQPLQPRRLWRKCAGMCSDAKTPAWKLLNDNNFARIKSTDKFEGICRLCRVQHRQQARDQKRRAKTMEGNAATAAKRQKTETPPPVPSVGARAVFQALAEEKASLQAKISAEVAHTQHDVELIKQYQKDIAAMRRALEDLRSARKRMHEVVRCEMLESVGGNNTAASMSVG